MFALNLYTHFASLISTWQQLLLKIYPSPLFGISYWLLNSIEKICQKSQISDVLNTKNIVDLDAERIVLV